ncbi:MAG: WhiB family transcriptional regulator [Actinomycetota bacterium]|nr:WhiB family transcriptional regulator [Actinomycetota bacterium]
MPSASDQAADAMADLLPRWTQQAWMEHSACKSQTHLFFPPLAERPQARVKRESAARRVCADCPVMVECRTYARVHREHGYWGGESEEERVRAGFAPSNPIGGSRLRRAS